MQTFRSLVLALAGAALASAVAAQSTLTGRLTTPFKATLTPFGNVLVAETGTGHHDGELTLVAAINGARFTLLSGLPSGATPEGVLGPTAVADAHRTLYVLIGEGDVLGPAAPPAQAPNPDGVSSPIFSSLLRARFTPVPDGIREGFALGPEEVRALADGREVVLENASGERVELLVLTDFRDLEPDPIRVVRQSNPFALAIAGSLTEQDLAELGLGDDVAAANFLARLDPDSPAGRRLVERTRLYVVDAGMNTVSEVAAATGRAVVLTRLPPLPNPLFPGVGGPVAEAVPTGVHVDPDGDLLVTTLSGFPFAPGAAKLFRIDAETGGFLPIVEGLSSAMDVVEVDGVLYVVELSTDFFAGAPGRVLRIAFPGAAPEVFAAGLIGPAGLVHDPARGELLVVETFTGRVRRFALP